MQCAVSLALVAIVSVPQTNFRSILNRQGNDRAKIYLPMCEWLRENIESTQSIGSPEFGYIGYYKDNPIVDLLGLTTPDLLPFVAKKDIISGFWKYSPDYYIHIP